MSIHSNRIHPTLPASMLWGHKRCLAPLVLLIILILLITAGCIDSQEKTIHIDYIASESRRIQIMNFWQKVQVGMNPEEVKQLMGEPDEILSVLDYNNVFSNRITGTSYWYIIERTGYENGKYTRESLVRVRFDNSHIVRQIDKWGF